MENPSLEYVILELVMDRYLNFYDDKNSAFWNYNKRVSDRLF